MRMEYPLGWLTNLQLNICTDRWTNDGGMSFQVVVLNCLWILIYINAPAGIKSFNAIRATHARLNLSELITQLESIFVRAALPFDLVLSSYYRRCSELTEDTRVMSALHCPQTTNILRN